jgi:UDP-N-acetylglucosamine 2-epimerase
VAEEPVAAIRGVSIVGARPQFVKLSPVCRAMREARRAISDQIVHTGRHYDDAMSRVFFDELDIPAPAVKLGVAGQGPFAARQAAPGIVEAICDLCESAT